MVWHDNLNWMGTVPDSNQQQQYVKVETVNK